MPQRMMRRARLLALLALPTMSAGSLRAQVCDGPALPHTTSRDLYCIELTPARGFSATSGRVALVRRPGPFTIDVTAEGRVRHAPVLTLAGLPRPESLGPYAAFVAWVATPVLHPVTRLGAVTNGSNDLPAITHDKFLILVTAEAAPNVAEMQGRVVMRGESPSTRLQPPDLMQFAIGAVPESATVSGQTHAGHGVQAVRPGGDSARWTTVPMPPGLQMLPAEMLLRPEVAPYLPRADNAVPTARPREVVRLRDGDTLRLRAGVVRRSFKGSTLTMYGFNDQYPGPLLVVPQGAEAVVELVNALDQPTTIHWHGVRLDNRFDGVPDLTQEPVKPGGRFVYRIRFPDAGIYWYHPHVREDVQQDLGLYGNMLVRSPRPDYFSPAHREEVLMLDDLLLNEDGLVPFGATVPTHALMGRFGNVMLVNGEPAWSDSAQAGEIVRYFLTNVSNTRTFNLSFPGARMKLVGSDLGNYEREEWVESVVIAPAERYIVHVRFDRPGRYALVNRIQVLDHLYGRFYYETDTLGGISVLQRPADRDLRGSFETLRADTAVRADIGRYRPGFTRPPDRTLVMTIATRGMPFFSRQIMQLDSIFFSPVEWEGTMPGMNWASTGDQVEWILRDPATGRQNMDVQWSFRRGDVVKVRLVNERASLHAMQHPIHIHGQRFLVLAVNDVPNTNLVWKDTVLVPAGFTVDVLLELSNPGRWMVHCHIAEHLSAHMMMTMVVH